MATKESHWSPLSENEAKKLLIPHENLRDPVHHDIKITGLERAIIDTHAFQRLRFINQLGPTHLVYPGAVHTRFLHSLGTLQYAEQLVQIANNNCSTYSQPTLMKIEAYPHLLVRLLALLHDVAHIPFGHALEDEGNLADSQWNDTQRVQLWLSNPDAEIPKAIRDFLADSKISSDATEKVVDDVIKYVSFKGDPMQLEFPFVIDLVGNTLCADLLDYLERDMYFCGLRERSGDRVVNYIAIVRVKEIENTSSGKNNPETTELFSSEKENGKGRVVLLTYRFEHEHPAGGKLKLVPQPKILSEAIDLLRRRYALSEKVYFHRTKLAASAMLISALGSSSLKLDEIYQLSDNEFLSKLRSDSNARTKYLTSAYELRRLYKPIYKLNYREERDADSQSKDLWAIKYPRFRDPDWRKEKEIYLEECLKFPKGSIAIYCPDRKMNLKAFRMLVQIRPDSEIKPLEKILDTHRKLEMQAINEPFTQLWNLFIYVDPKVLDVTQFANETVQDLNSLCENIVGFPNDIIELQGKGRAWRVQLADRAIQDWQQEFDEKVPYDVFNELVAAPHSKEGSDLMKAIHNHLRALMKSEKPPRQLKLEGD